MDYSVRLFWWTTLLDYSTGLLWWSSLFDSLLDFQLYYSAGLYSVRLVCWTTFLDYADELLCLTSLLDHSAGLHCWTTMLNYSAGLLCWNTLLHCSAGQHSWTFLLDKSTRLLCWTTVLYYSAWTTLRRIIFYVFTYWPHWRSRTAREHWTGQLFFMLAAELFEFNEVASHVPIIKPWLRSLAIYVYLSFSLSII